MTEDPQWTAFLQWALPQLRMRWSGFRKVRTQVHKRVHRRLQSLQLAGPDDYRSYLQQYPEEWRVLDTLCRISISRFCRDKGIYGLPAAWRESAFTESTGRYCLQSAYKRPVLFVEHDVRGPVPATALQLILCRNLVYTYYDEGLQREITQRLIDALQPGGLLVVGSHETLPYDVPGFTPCFAPGRSIKRNV